MRFFPIDPRIDQQVDNILKTVRLRMNGETADMLARMGIHYRYSYGASLVHLRQMAAPMDKNNTLAARLWHMEIRETMILATLVADPNTMRPNELLEWAELVDNTELTEQISMNLLARANNLPTLCETLARRTSPYIRASAYFATGWAIRQNHAGVNAQAMQALMDQCTFDHPIVARGFAHLLCQAIRCLPNGTETAREWLQQPANAENPLLASARGEIEQELDFMTNRQ